MLCLFSAVVCAPLQAQASAASEATNQNAPLPAESPRTIENPFDKSGLLSAEEIFAELGVQPTAEQRAAIAIAAAKRNAALAAANAELRRTLSVVLKTDSVGLANRAEEEKERRRLDKIRRFQPGRYQAIMKAKK